MAFHGKHKEVKRVCVHCGTEYLSKYTGSKNRYFCSSHCRAKDRASARRVDHVLKVYELYNGAKFRAKTKNLPFDLTQDFLLDLWNKQEGKCLICKRVFEWGSSTTRTSRLAPTVDRIDSTKGYTQDNIRLVTFHVNVAINQWGLAAFKELCEDVLR